MSLTVKHHFRLEESRFVELKEPLVDADNDTPDHVSFGSHSDNGIANDKDDHATNDYNSDNSSGCSAETTKISNKSLMAAGLSPEEEDLFLQEFIEDFRALPATNLGESRHVILDFFNNLPTSIGTSRALALGSVRYTILASSPELQRGLDRAVRIVESLHASGGWIDFYDNVTLEVVEPGSGDGHSLGYESMASASNVMDLPTNYGHRRS